MTNVAVRNSYSAMDEENTLTLERMLPGPIERVWSYLTQSELRRKWLAAGDMGAGMGSSFELVWRNHELSDEPGNKPEGFGSEHRLESEVTAFDPPRKLAFTWGSTGGVTFELEPRGEAVLLKLTHRRIMDRSSQLNICAGWHAHLDVLEARLAGDAPGPFWDHWVALKSEYELRIPQ